MKKNLLSAVLLLSVFSLVDRALGFVFRIYLSRELGASALGVYQVATSLFFVLLSLLTSGIPLAVSKLTAKYVATKGLKSERALVSAALVLECLLSITIILVVIVLKKPISASLTSGKSYNVLLLLLPALFFSALAGAVKGNLWGHENFFIGSVGEIVEQTVRFSVCLALFSLGLDKLSVTALSLSVGCFCSMLVVFIYYVAKGSRFSRPNGYIVPLLQSSAPVTVSRAVGSVVGSLTAIIVPLFLMRSGMSEAEAMAQYGASAGMAMPLLFLPITVVGSMSFVLVPTLASDTAHGENAAAAERIRAAIAATVTIACGCIPLFSALGKPIGTFLYDNSAAGSFLSSVAWVLLPLSVESITSSQMNSLDLELRAFVNYLIGAAAQLIVMLCFMNNFTIYIFGLSTGISLSVTSLLNIYSIFKRLKCRLGAIQPTVTAFLLTFPTSFITRCVFDMTASLPVIAALAIASVAGAAFYLGLCFVFLSRLRLKTLATSKKKVL